MFLGFEDLQSDSLKDKLSLIPEKLLVNFLHISATFISHLKISIQPWIGLFGHLYVTILNLCSEKEIKTKVLRKTCTKTLTILFKEFAIFPDLVKDTALELLGNVREQLEKLSISSISSVPGLLRVISEWSNTEAFHCLFDKSLLKSISSIYERPAKKEVFEICNLILLRLFGVEDSNMVS